MDGADRHSGGGEHARGIEGERPARGIDPADRDDARVPGQRGIRIVSEIEMKAGMARV